MTSSNRNPNRGGRGLLWLIGLLLLAFALYSASWFWAAARVRSETSEAIAALEARGISAECADMKIGGYPLGLTVTCERLAYRDDRRAVAAVAGNLQATASLFGPLAPVLYLDGPLRAEAPGIAPLRIDWGRLQATTALWWPMPSRVTVTAQGLSGQTDPQGADQVRLFTVESAEAEFSPLGRALGYRGQFSRLAIEADAIGGRVLPPLNGAGEAILTDGITLLRGGSNSLRGHTAEIAKLELVSGEAGISLSGPIAVDEEGLVDASLEISLRDPKAVGAILSAAIPERKRQIEQAFSALAMLGSTPMTLKIVKGRAALGFIPLGRIPPFP